jgi:hypothetical protein
MDCDDLNLLPTFAGYGALQHWWSQSWRSNAVFGWLKVDNQKGETDTSLERTLYTALNLVWSPVKQMVSVVKSFGANVKTKTAIMVMLLVFSSAISICFKIG